MDITIQSLHFDAKQDLKDFIKDKVGKLFHHHPKMKAADVCLKVEKSDTRENKLVEIKVSGTGLDLFAKKQSASFEEGVVEAVAALEHQLGKKKQNLSVH